MARRNSGWRGTSKSRYYLMMGAWLVILGVFFYIFDMVTVEPSLKILAQSSCPAQYTATSSSESFMLVFVSILIVPGVISLILGLIHRKKERQIAEKMRGLTGNGAPASDFLAARGALRQSDFTGVYVLHNLTKDMYYVGQSVKVVDRVTQHLTGHGNGDVYADYKYGDEFEVSTVSLVESGYGSLNDLERDTITAYDAYNHGYNRTAGNTR